MKFSLIVLTLITLISCNKDKTPIPIEEEIIEPYVVQDYINIGDSVSNTIQFVSFSPIITLDSHNSVEIHEIDMNSDGTNDFQLNLYSYLAFAGTWFKGTTIKIKSLHPEAEISIDTSYTAWNFFYPFQYLENDLLEQQSLWGTDEYTISINGDDSSDSCDAPGCPMVSHGTWFGQSNQYIGVRMYGTSLGWIKISLPTTDPHSKQTLLIEEYGYIP